MIKGATTIKVIISTLLGITICCLMRNTHILFFYKVFIGALISGATALLLEHYTNPGKNRNKTQSILTIMVAILLTFSFLSTVPLTIDRSYSVWMLKNMNNYEEKNLNLTKSIFYQDAQVFFNPSNGELLRRLNEQIQLGNIEVKPNETYVLTGKGKFISRINHWIGNIFGLNPKYSQLK